MTIQAAKQQEEYLALKAQMARAQSMLEHTQSQLQAERKIVKVLQDQQIKWLEEEANAMHEVVEPGEPWDTVTVAPEVSTHQDPQEQDRLQKVIQDLQNSYNAAILSRQTTIPNIPQTSAG